MDLAELVRAVVVVGAVDEPIFLVRAAASLPRFRRRVEHESPEPLRSRRLFAPADFLMVA